VALVLGALFMLGAIRPPSAAVQVAALGLASARVEAHLVEALLVGGGHGRSMS
jgi:hypothetical protein